VTANKTEHTEVARARVAVQDNTVRESRHHTECPTGRDEFTAWLIASCQRQDLPVTITDATLLATIATLLR
jgi:hypothetical protein